MIKFMVMVELDDELGNAWLQHVQNFNNKYPKCKFEVVASAPEKTTGEIANMLKITPPLSVFAETSVEKAKKTLLELVDYAAEHPDESVKQIAEALGKHPLTVETLLSADATKELIAAKREGREPFSKTMRRQ